MKNSELEKKIKASVRKHYIRKSRFDALSKKLDRLQKKVARLEKLCRQSNNAKPAPKKSSPKKAPAAVHAPAGADKLTKIKGIGPVLEGKLRKLGVDRFLQIANWNEKDIERISEHLDFKGRIEREEWVRQAKELK